MFAVEASNEEIQLDENHGEVPISEPCCHIEFSRPLHDSTFKSNFRFGKSQVEDMLQVLGPEYRVRTPRLPLRKLLLVALKTLASLETYSSIGAQFELSEWETVECVHHFCSLVKNHFSHHIVWPVGEEATRVISGFQAFAGFPGVIGSLGVTHVVFQDHSPLDFSKNTYVNRRGERSVAVLLTVDHEMRITFYHGGEAGNTQESSMLFDSQLAEFLPAICQWNPSGGTHVIASAEFPQQQWLLTPFVYDGNLTRMQMRYNDKIKNTQSLFKVASGLLKFKFPRLKDVGYTSIPHVCDIAHAACILYNMCLEPNDMFSDFEAEHFPIGKLFKSGGDDIARAKRNSFTVFFRD